VRRLRGERLERRIGEAQYVLSASWRVRVARRYGVGPEGMHLGCRVRSRRGSRRIIAAMSVAVVAASWLAVAEMPAPARAQAAFCRDLYVKNSLNGVVTRILLQGSPPL